MNKEPIVYDIYDNFNIYIRRVDPQRSPFRVILSEEVKRHKYSRALTSKNQSNVDILIQHNTTTYEKPTAYTILCSWLIKILHIEQKN